MWGSSKTRGFTLIELLVVIAIIGLLSAVVLASMNGSRAKARDARRKADLKSLRVSLELFYDKYGMYPAHKASTSCGGTDGWASSYGTCGSQWLTTDSRLNEFISTVPMDPLNVVVDTSWSARSGNTGNYVYSYYSYGTEYDLITQLENTTMSAICRSIQMTKKLFTNSYREKRLG
jgi:prepilin-type N-terminal cleavage/methylation domain-containing protein